MSASHPSPARPSKAPWLARHPAWGMAVMLVGAVAFVALAFNVKTGGPLTAWDLPVADSLHERATHGSDLARKAAIFTSTFGRETAGIIVAVLGVYWLWKRQWRLLSLLIIGVLGGNTWFEVLSRFFQRHRPVFPDPLDPLPGPGFPSGHSMTSLLLYSLIAYVVYPRLTRVWRIVLGVAATLVPLVVGFSRMFLGAHYFTDVLGGYTFGMFWGGLVYTTLEVYFYRREQRKAVSAVSA
ncbi:MAG: phosphatase PAP2 family protein [Anaerolineales bacterium]